MFDIGNFHEVLKRSVEFGSLTMVFVVAYRFLTTRITRKLHHRQIRVLMYKIHNISWFKLTKSASYYILAILNKLYGAPNNPSKVFSNCYFNQRSWKASFTFALSYLSIGAIILPVYLAPVDYDLNLIYKFIGLVSLFGVGCFLLKTKKSNGKAKNKYRQSFVSVIFIFAFSTIYNVGVIGDEVFILLILACLPMLFVWRDGLSGLCSYILSIVLYMCLIINFLAVTGLVAYEISEYQNEHVSAVEENSSVKSESEKSDNDPTQEDKDGINYSALILNVVSIFILSLFVYVCDRKGLSYKLFYKCLIVITLTLNPVVLFYKVNLEAAFLYLIFLFYFLYAWFFIWGVVSANSLADLISSNVSRWLFLKIQHYQKWRQILSASVTDMCVGSILVLLASLLITVMLSSLFIIFWNESPVSIYQAMLLAEETFKSSSDSTNDVFKFVNEFNLFYIIDPIINSYYLVPKYFSNEFIYDHRIDNSEYASILDELGYGLWYLYCSTLIPTIMHGGFIVLLSISKSANHIIQRPALYAHQLLLENATEDGALGKAFSGSSRAIVFIGIAFTTISFVIFSLINAYMR